MRGLSKEIESAIKSMLTGLSYPIKVDLLDDDKVKVTMDSKLSSFNSTKKLLNKWINSENAPSHDNIKYYATQLMEAGYDALENLREALSKDIDYANLDEHKFDKAIKAKPIILETIFDLEASIQELNVQIDTNDLSFGEKEYKVGYPEKFANGEFFKQSDYHKNWYDDREDAVIICPFGTKGEMIVIDELKIWLPKVPKDKSKILFSDLPKKDQYWRRPEPPKNIRPDNVDHYHDYIMEEYRRRREGIWFMNNGKPTYLTGNAYWALTHCLMKDDGDYMKFRIAQLFMFYHLEACIVDKRCLGQIFLKSRRTGFTYIVLAILLNMSTSTGNGKYGMTSKSGDDVEEAFEKFSYMFLNLPFYFRPVVKGKEDSLTGINFSKPSENTKEAKKSRKMDVADYLNTVIDHRPTKNGSYDSVKLNGYLGDECGKWEKPMDYIIHLAMIRPTMMPNGKVVGKSFLGSTMNAMANGGAQFKILIEGSQIHKRNAITKKTPTALYFHFLPAHKNMEEYTDIYGVCHEVKPPAGTRNYAGDLITEGSLDYLLAVEDSLKGNDKALNEQYRTYPRTIEHAMRDEATQSTFNLTKLYDQLESNNKLSKEDLYSTGNFVWKDGIRDTEVEWYPNPKGRFKISWLPSEVDDTFQYRNNYKEVNGKFYPLNDELGAFGCDPFSIKSTVGEGSKGAISGKTKFNTYGVPSNKFFLQYAARPQDEEIFFEDVIMACVFYGMPVLVESNRIDLLRYMRNRGYRGFALNRLDKSSDKLNPNEKEYGGQVMSGKDILDSHMNSIGAWIEKYVGYSNNEAVRPLDEMGEMPFEETLKDWISFDPDDRTKYDLTISSGLAIMACQKEKYKPVVKKRDMPKINTFVRKFNNSGSVGALQKNKNIN